MTAKTFAREGSAVVVVDRNEAGAQQVVEEIRSAGGTAEPMVANVGNPADIEAMIRFATDKFGRLDVLHNNAIYTVMGRVAEVALEDWQRTMDVSLTGYWYATRAALPVMVRQGKGIILNTASTAGLSGNYNMGAYNVVKAGVLNLTRVTAIEYARKGIRCNAVCPGPVDTPGLRFAASNSEEWLNRNREAVPMGRFATTQELANVFLFLASDESSFITGAAIVADGGITAYSGTPYIPKHGPDW